MKNAAWCCSPIYICGWRGEPEDLHERDGRKLCPRCGSINVEMRLYTAPKEAKPMSNDTMRDLLIDIARWHHAGPSGLPGDLERRIQSALGYEDWERGRYIDAIRQTPPPTMAMPAPVHGKRKSILDPAVKIVMCPKHSCMEHPDCVKATRLCACAECERAIAAVEHKPEPGEPLDRIKGQFIGMLSPNWMKPSAQKIGQLLGDVELVGQAVVAAATKPDAVPRENLAACVGMLVELETFAAEASNGWAGLAREQSFEGPVFGRVDAIRAAIRRSQELRSRQPITTFAAMSFADIGKSPAFQALAAESIKSTLSDAVKSTAVMAAILGDPSPRTPSGDPDYTAMSAGEMVDALGGLADRWAKAFAQYAAKLGIRQPKARADGSGSDFESLDEGWLIGWFANAMQAAVDADRKRRQDRLRPIRKYLRARMMPERVVEDFVRLLPQGVLEATDRERALITAIVDAVESSLVTIEGKLGELGGD